MVLKYYKEPLLPEKIEKLNLMVSMSHNDLLHFAAWPIDVVKNNIGLFCGFTMTRLEGYVPLHMLFTPSNRKNLFPDKGYNFLIHVARNLAISFHKIHQNGIVVGDVNEANILVSKTGMIAFIDCDSFQITNGVRYYYCEVGMLRYTPPELLKLGGFNQTIRTKNTDAFSLATLIFQLLFLGRAPFTGINLQSQELDEETAIKEQDFAYSLRKLNKRLFPAKNSLEINLLYPGLVSAFHDAFENINNRPTPLIWANELQLQYNDLVSCSNSKIHFYPSRSINCLWCKFKEEDNIHYFLDDSYLRTLPELNDIEQFVNGFRLEPLQVKILPTSYKTGNFEAKPIGSHFKILRSINWLFYLVILIATLLLCFQNIIYLLGGLILILIFANVSPTKRKLKEELSLREQTFKQTKEEFLKVIKQHNNSPDYNQYNQSARKLTSVINEYQRLPIDYSTGKKEIEENHYQAKLVQYLNKFEILYAQINGFGPSKKRLLYSEGIKTAADISKLNRIKVLGIGPKNEQILYDWQRHISAGFTYKPDNQIINTEIKQLSDILLKKRQVLEQQIRQQYKLVASLRNSLISSLKTLESKYNQLQPKVHQAELDYNYFQKWLSI